MKLLTDKYLKDYRKLVGNKLRLKYKELENNTEQNNFEYYIESSAVYSCNIEGNSIDLNSFMNSKLQKHKIKNKETVEILDLIKGYDFAKEIRLNNKNFLEAHRIFSNKILIKSKRGKYREERVGVFDSKGLVYLAIEPEFAEKEMKKLFSDIKELNSDLNLNLEECFYYASMIHLVFVLIHPFMDGNGRAARLLEKWFLSQKLGAEVWKIKSEKYYKENISEYYSNINLGPNYHETNYDFCLPFLEMLFNAIENRK